MWIINSKIYLPVIPDSNQIIPLKLTDPFTSLLSILQDNYIDATNTQVNLFDNRFTEWTI